MYAGWKYSINVSVLFDQSDVAMIYTVGQDCDIPAVPAMKRSHYVRVTVRVAHQID